MISVTGRRLCVLWYENTKALRNSKMIIMVTGATAGLVKVLLAVLSLTVIK